MRLRTPLLRLEMKIEGVDKLITESTNKNIDINKIMDDMRNELPESKPFLLRIINKEDILIVISDYERFKLTRKG
jgi:hypothetical protein